MHKFFALIMLLITHPAYAGDIEISNTWIPEAPPVSRVHAGYMQIANRSAEAIELVGAVSPGYRSVEIHLSIEKDGVASMRRIDAITVPAGGEVSLEAGGYHLMLIGPKDRLKQGDEVALTLEFADGDRIDVTARVKKASADQGHDHHHHHGHH